jgi:hypothetical protein
MGGMEFTWRMVGALIWPVVVLAGLIAYRPWITKRLESLRFKAAGIEGEVKVLNAKVDTIGLDISATLSEMPRPIARNEIPASLVDLIPVVNRNRSEGLHAAFELVVRALKASYSQLARVPLSQLNRAMDSLVDRREMEADVAASVRQLQELLEMPEWNVDQVGDTRGYAFLMLAEGAIHEILRTAEHRAAGADGGGLDIARRVRPSWRGTYDGRFPIELRILGWEGTQFSGIMTYPDGDTVTSVGGQIDGQIESAGVNLSWKEIGYVLNGRRDIDFNGSYAATVIDDQMDAQWLKSGRVIVQFKMSAVELPSSPAS